MDKVVELIEAAKRADWQQVVSNGGPPCFHIGNDGDFCLRARRWEGHGCIHPFTTLAAVLEVLAPKVCEHVFTDDRCDKCGGVA